MAKYTDETVSKLVINMLESKEQYQNLETVPEKTGTIALVEDIDKKLLPDYPAEEGKHTLQLTMKDGSPSLEWIASA